MCIYTCIYLYISLSLSLSFCIYICIYLFICYDNINCLGSFAGNISFSNGFDFENEIRGFGAPRRSPGAMCNNWSVS